MRETDRDGRGHYHERAYYFWARRLHVPFNRVYAAVSALGMDGIKSDADVIRIVCFLQAKAVHFSSLAELYGDEVTLGELARYEALP